MKKAIIACVTACMLMTSGLGFAAEAKVTISKTNLIEMALKNNPQVGLYQSQIDIAKDRYGNAMVDVDIWKNKEPEEKSGTSERVQNARINKYYPQLYTNEMNELKDKKLRFEKNLKVDVEEQYYKYLMLLDREQYQRDYLSRLEKEKKVLATKIKLGQVSNAEMTKMETEVIKGEIDLASLASQKNSAEIELELLVGKDVDMSQLAKVDMPTASLKVKEIASLMERYVTQHPEVYWRNEKLKLEQVNYDISVKYRNLRSLEAEVLTMEQTIENLKYEIQEQTVKAKNGLSKAYSDVMKAKNEMDMQALKVKYQGDLTKAAEAKKAAGMITEMDYLIQKQASEQAVIELKEKQLNYYVLVTKFNADVESSVSLTK